MALSRVIEGLFYGDIPLTLRKNLERTLVNLWDGQKARESFLEVVPSGADNAQNIMQAIVEGKTDLLKKEGPRLNNYHPFGPNFEPLEQLDIWCACAPESRQKWESVLSEFGVSTRKHYLNPCALKNCKYSEEYLGIPIRRETNIIIPDEGGFDETDIIPEIHIAFPSEGELYRRFIQYVSNSPYISIRADLWWIYNTCGSHGEKMSLNKIEHFSNCKVSQAFSDRIYDQTILSNPPGMEINTKI